MLLSMRGGLMRPGQAHERVFTIPNPSPRSEASETGLLTTSSDSIGRDSRAPHAPNLKVRRQTEHTDPGSTKIPCFPVPYNTKHFSLWIQSVAVESRSRLRPSKTVHSPTKRDEVEMATFRCFSASLFYRDNSVNPLSRDAARLTHDADLMAYPEVKRCR